MIKSVAQLKNKSKHVGRTECRFFMSKVHKAPLRVAHNNQLVLGNIIIAHKTRKESMH